MSNTEEKYRALRIFNPHGLLSAALGAGITPPVVLLWQKGVAGRSYQPAGYYVVELGVKTDPEAHWTHRGNKFFMKFKDEPFEANAKAWASERYGVTEWVKIAGFPRHWFTPEVAAFAKALLKDAK